MEEQKMKKIMCWISAITAVGLISLFVFYFFKMNPQYRPDKIIKSRCGKCFEK